jgi:hypothetical protein
MSLVATMDEGLSVPVSCCKCGRRSCRRSTPKSMADDALSFLGWYPWRCTGCGARFYLRRKLNDPYVQIGSRDMKRDLESTIGQKD